MVAILLNHKESLDSITKIVSESLYDIHYHCECNHLSSKHLCLDHIMVRGARGMGEKEDQLMKLVLLRDFFSAGFAKCGQPVWC